jgi:radical SAM protein with 4Fe4S-binding SPASM domain
LPEYGPDSIHRLVCESKSILREVEQEHLLDMTGELVGMTSEDPMCLYDQAPYYPRYVVWELTLACNMRCTHCGSRAGRGRPNELGLDEMLRLCDELGEMKCERLTLLGGEPLIHPHWLEIAARLRQNGTRVNVITNGWVLDSETVCDNLEEAKLSIVGISLDGLEESHDRLRRAGSFRRIERGMDLLRERNLPIAVVTMITKESLPELPELYEYIVEKGVKVWQLQIALPLGNLGRRNPLLLEAAHLERIFEIVAEKNELHDDIRIDLADNIGYFSPLEYEYERAAKRSRRLWTGCYAGIQVMGIDSNGDIKGCQSLPSIPRFIEGNIRERSLRDIWNDPDSFTYNRKFTISQLSGFCARCEYGSLCKAGCTAAAFSYTGHIGENPMCAHRYLMERDG